MKTLNIDDCYRRYGRLQGAPEGGMLWREAPDWIKPLPVPDQIVLRYGGKPVYRIFCNTDIHAPLAKAFQNLIDCGAHLELETFDGCFNVRWVRGYPGVPSLHSFGIAVDFNASKNPLGRPGTWSPLFLSCFESAGFINGGQFPRQDFMHFELAKLP